INESTEHIFNTEFDRLDYQLSLEDMLLDLKVLIKEYYCGTFTNDGKSLKITLNNGQKFLLNMTAI
ncbi:MAG: hypothetical protein K2I46_02410, partial [Clostridia bacterium]|nr:hypothetical protein [Clostridia bacterium]